MKSKFRKLVVWFAVVWLMALANIITSVVNAYDLTQSSVTFTMPDHDVSLRAISQANSYTIIFNKNWGAGTMSNLAMTYDVSNNLTKNVFIKTWYTFLWWSTDSWATSPTYADEESVSNLTSVNGWTVTLYAIWKANTYKVAFNINSDSDTQNVAVWSMSNQNFTYDQSQALTANSFVRTWYTFAGRSLTAWWDVVYTNGQSVSNLTATSGVTVTLFAKWTADSWIKYVVNHYMMTTWWTYTATPTYSDEFTAITYQVVSPDPRNDAWFTLSWTAQTWHVKWDGTTVFNYYYSRDQHIVTLVAGRGIESISWDWTYYYNQDVVVSAVMKPWYTWLTWAWDKTVPNFKMPTSDVNMSASATPIVYSITYDVWSGTISWEKVTYDIEEWFVLVDPTRTWYDFVWWSGTNLATPISWLVIDTWTYWDLNYEAVWTPRWDVTFKVHHYIKKVWLDEYEEFSVDTYNTWVADDELILADYQIVIPCMTYTGWTLTESLLWLTDQTLNTIVLPDGTTEVYLYYSRNKYTVTLEKDANIASVLWAWEYECGATVTINATPKTWYSFLHWLDIWEIHLNN